MAQFHFDAAAVAETFKITVGCKTPIPPAVQPGEIVVYYPPFSAFDTLSKSRVWRDRIVWRVPRETAELSWVKPGYWRVLHKTSGTSNCDWDTALANQQRLLGCAWKRAPLTVLAVALVMHWTYSLCDHRDEETFRCGDLFPSGQWSQCIDRFCGNLILDSAADRRAFAPNVWLASAQYVG